MAASENTGGRPGRPALGACHTMSLSSHPLIAASSDCRATDQQRSTPLQRFVLGLPVRRAVAGRFGLAHAPRLNLPDSRRESPCHRVLQQRLFHRLPGIPQHYVLVGGVFSMAWNSACRGADVSESRGPLYSPKQNMAATKARRTIIQETFGKPENRISGDAVFLVCGEISN